MALTRVRTSSTFRFLQPALEGTVSITLDAGIRWLTEGSYISIPQGGFYRIESISVFAFVIKLKRAITPTGQLVESNIVYPIVDYGDDNNIKVIELSALDLASNDPAGIVSYINTVAGFVKDTIDTIIIKVTDGDFYSLYALVDKRRGTYGLGGLPIYEEDLLLTKTDKVKLTSSDDSITIVGNDIVVNTTDWALDNDLNNLTPNIIV